MSHVTTMSKTGSGLTTWEKVNIRLRIKSSSINLFQKSTNIVGLVGVDGCSIGLAGLAIIVGRRRLGRSEIFSHLIERKFMILGCHGVNSNT